MKQINFYSLIHQYDATVAKGYYDSEICQAVIKAIGPGMTLRGLLECKPDLNLLNLRKILHSHSPFSHCTMLSGSMGHKKKFQSVSHGI